MRRNDHNQKLRSGAGPQAINGGYFAWRVNPAGSALGEIYAKFSEPERRQWTKVALLIPTLGEAFRSFAATQSSPKMKNTSLAVIFSLSIIGLTSGAGAQTAEPSYKGDPDVYKIIFEDANFRVIEATRKKGVHDKLHSHPVASVIYYVTDCPAKLYDGDGKVVREDTGKAGTANAVPVISAHSAENTGSGDCKQVFFEKK